MIGSPEERLQLAREYFAKADPKRGARLGDALRSGHSTAAYYADLAQQCEAEMAAAGYGSPQRAGQAQPPIAVIHELGNECRSLSVDCEGYRVSLGYVITPERQQVAPNDALHGDRSLRDTIEACCAQIRARDHVAIAKMIANSIVVRIGTADRDGPPTPLPADYRTWRATVDAERREIEIESDRHRIAVIDQLRALGYDPDGPLIPLPAPQVSAERVFAAPAHDYLAALHRPYVPPV